MLKPSLMIKTNSAADKSQVYIHENLRITYLTSRLLRVETGSFVDLPSYAVWNRKFPSGRLDIRRKGSELTAETEDIILTIKNKKPYSVCFKESGSTELF